MSSIRQPSGLFGVLACWTALLITSPKPEAMSQREYDAESHQRFEFFPSAPEINTSHIFASVDLTGVGFKSSGFPTVQCALITRKHVLFARHYGYIINGEALSFVAADGRKVERSCVRQTSLYKDGYLSDLLLVELDEPIDASWGISPLPYFAEDPVVGETPLGVIGRSNYSGVATERVPTLGVGTVNGAPRLTGLGGGVVTMTYRFDYLNSPEQPDPSDCLLQSGDSGSPTFVPVRDRAALIGIHSAICGIYGGQGNLDTHVPSYVNELDLVLSSHGFRMRPHNAAPATLTVAGRACQDVPRKSMALDYQYDLNNSGAELAGNVEFELIFSNGEGPDSVNGPSGWVAYGSGDFWTMRRAAFTASSKDTITLSWEMAPSVSALSFVMTLRSDASPEIVLHQEIKLAESCASWAGDIMEAGQQDDPDHDGISNLMEYALGGDPAVPGRHFADGSSLLPVLHIVGGSPTFSHPERSDKGVRGLSYQIEFSTDLQAWTTTQPPGFSSTTAAYGNEGEGFVRRQISWSRNSAYRFARLKITINE